MGYNALCIMVAEVEKELRKEWRNPHSHYALDGGTGGGHIPSIKTGVSGEPCFHCLANHIACYCRNYTEELMLAKVKGISKEVLERMTK